MSLFNGNGAGAAKSKYEINEFFLIVGLAMLVFYLTCLLLQTQTTESFAGSGVIVRLIQPDPAVLWQIPALFLGQLSAANVVVVIFGWGSEIAYLAAIVGFKQFHNAIGIHNKLLADACAIVAGIIVGFQGYSDFVYGQAVITGFLGQLAFAVIVSFIVSSFGIGGIHFIKVGLGLEKKVVA